VAPPIDDHSRYAYVEQDPDQSGNTAAAVLGPAIDHADKPPTGRVHNLRGEEN
jgi:hypothetical protein